MKWLEVTINIEPQWQEAMTRFFEDEGIQGIEIIDPDAFRQVLNENRYLDYADDGFLDSLGDQVVMKAYFCPEQDKNKLEKRLQQAFLRNSFIPAPICTFSLRDDSEWKDNWKKQYKTFSISKRVIIKPSWENFEACGDQIVIELDPGMAFGTGTHETTGMCAAFLDEMVKGNEKVLDLGCGTGILGMIAAKLGASEVKCVDIDDAACKTARENARNNHVDGLLTVSKGRLEDLLPAKYDIIIINIITDVILSLIPKLKIFCKTGTKIILSGIIREREPEVLKASEENRYGIGRKMYKGEWVALQICTDC